MTWDEVKQKVEENGNLTTLTMEELRDVMEVSRLGVHIRDSISRKLAGIGLGHIPRNLPSYQHEQVRIYKRGTTIGDLIDQVMSPGQQNDRKLAEQFSEEPIDYAEIVAKIREIVSE